MDLHNLHFDLHGPRRHKLCLVEAVREAYEEFYSHADAGRNQQ